MHSGDKINCNLIFKVKPKLRANLTRYAIIARIGQPNQNGIDFVSFYNVNLFADQLPL